MIRITSGIGYPAPLGWTWGWPRAPPCPGCLVRGGQGGRDDTLQEGAEPFPGLKGQAAALHLEKAFPLELTQEPHGRLRAETGQSSKLPPTEG